MSFAGNAHNGEVGKDGGTKELAAAGSYTGMCVCEYVWVDANGETRCKSKTATKKPQEPDDCLIWMCNGASTGQATTEESDVYLVPRAVFDDPIRGPGNCLIMCEAVTNTMEPAKGNYRASCTEVMDKFATSDPWVGMEQEYTIMTADGSAPMATGEEGGCNCGVGSQNVPQGMRQLMDAHYGACLAAGVKIAGCNMESAPGQGEFQIGPCQGVDIGDQVMMARHLLKKISEGMGMGVSFAPKPSATQSGSGCHTNLSTNETRGDGGLAMIEKICRAYGRKYKEHNAAYGVGNESRCTGGNLTPEYEKFTFAIASRNASVRIPRNVGMTGRGHLEDRRPGANSNPYQVAGMVMKTAGEVIRAS